MLSILLVLSVKNKKNKTTLSKGVMGQNIERQSPSPSAGPPWDVNSEKMCSVVNGERQIIFLIPFELSHGLLVNLKDYFASQESLSLS